MQIWSGGIDSIELQMDCAARIQRFRRAAPGGGSYRSSYVTATVTLMAPASHCAVPPQPWTPAAGGRGWPGSSPNWPRRYSASVSTSTVSTFASDYTTASLRVVALAVWHSGLQGPAAAPGPGAAESGHWMPGRPGLEVEWSPAWCQWQLWPAAGGRSQPECPARIGVHTTSLMIWSSNIHVRTAASVSLALNSTCKYPKISAIPSSGILYENEDCSSPWIRNLQSAEIKISLNVSLTSSCCDSLAICRLTHLKNATFEPHCEAFLHF
jgi:hypothetical protein